MVKFTQERMEAQEKGQRIPKFHFEKFPDYGGGIKFLHGSEVHKSVSRRYSKVFNTPILTKSYFQNFHWFPYFRVIN